VAFDWYIFSAIVVLFIIGITFTVVIIIQWIGIRKEKKIDKSTEVINLLSDWTHGHSKGWLVKQTKTPSKRTRVEFYPEVFPKSITKKDIEKPKTEVVIANNVQTIPKGVLSAYTNQLWIFPNTVNEAMNKLPFIKFENEVFDLLDKDGKIKEELKKLYKLSKEKNKELKEPINKLIEKIEKLSKKKKNEDLKKELEPLEKELKEHINNTKNFKSILEKIKENVINITTKDLFHNSILLKHLMSNVGDSMKKGYDTVFESVNLVNYGGMGALERKKKDEETEFVKKFLSKAKDEDKTK